MSGVIERRLDRLTNFEAIEQRYLTFVLNDEIREQEQTTRAFMRRQASMMAWRFASSSAVIDIPILSRLLGDGRLLDPKYVKAIWQCKRKRTGLDAVLLDVPLHQ